MVAIPCRFESDQRHQKSPCILLRGLFRQTSSDSEAADEAGYIFLVVKPQLVGTVLQDSDGQFIGLTVGEDVAFALENDCVELGEMKETVQTADGKTENAAQAEIEAARARMLVKPSGLVNFFTMFYGFVCMFIMYGAQQYTKAFGMSNCGLTEAQAAGMTSIYTVGSVIAVVFWAVMMGKLQWNPLKVVLIDSIFTAVALAIVLLVSNVAVIYVAIALLGFFAAGGALQTGLGIRQEMCPGPKGRNTGIYYTWMGLASCFLPYIVSAMTTSIGEAAAVYTMMGLLLAAAVIAILMMLYLVSQYKKIFGKSALTK